MSAPFFKNKKALALTTALFAAIVATFVVVNKNNNTSESVKNSTEETITDSIRIAEFYKQEEAKPCINPPLKGINIPFNSAIINVTKGGVIHAETGTTLTVPKNAFMDESGNLVKGEIELRYREFKDPVDFFVAGIPMTYDSAGVRYHFESAGMIEITAYQNGKPLNMASEKSINVELSSNDKNPAHNLYKLDTVKNNWSCLGKDKISTKKNKALDDKTKAETTATENKIIETQKAELTKQKEAQLAALSDLTPQPQKPVKANNTKYNFNIEVDASEHPELAVYKGVLFQVGDENKNFNEASYKVIWDDAIISEGPKKDENYLLTLKKGPKKYPLIVYPVFEGKNYDAAQKVYQEKFTKYNTLLAKRAENEKRIEEEYQNKLAQLKKRELDIQRTFEDEQKREFQRLNAQEKIIRTFAINSFGVYNCDRAMPYPTGVSCVSQLTVDGKQLLCYDVFLVEGSINALFNFYKNPVLNFSYNPQSKNILWTVENGTLYWLKPEQFNDIKIENKKAVLPMNKINATFKSAEEIKAFFKI
jgi:hypothetical protein